MKSVYLLKSHIDGEYIYKIGISKNTYNRLKQLFTSNPSLSLIKTFRTKHNEKLESSLHNYFKIKRNEGEWFYLSEEDVENFYNVCNKLEKNLDVLKKNNPFY